MVHSAGPLFPVDTLRQPPLTVEASKGAALPQLEPLAMPASPSHSQRRHLPQLQRSGDGSNG
eukprot:CAMPEP_0115326532 /NCGR_PEP_ID=MMETSP0270-20121206/83624_1 /TAXON_ID=71861 /ORGANISM="Scrippsiella trochoidea, Strain CCMP3099" /LENGTH=61 /DNA_ID=CAMNT_0002746847 /DNA_START=38 /DNA_END=220 /DNA_ORIENTATION=-